MAVNPRTTALLFLIGLAIGCTLVGIAAFMVDTVVGVLTTGILFIVGTHLLLFLATRGGSR